MLRKTNSSKLQVWAYLLQYCSNVPCYARQIAQNCRSEPIYYSTVTMFHVTQDKWLKISFTFDTCHQEGRDLPGRLLKVNLTTYYYTYVKNRLITDHKICFIVYHHLPTCFGPFCDHHQGVIIGHKDAKNIHNSCTKYLITITRSLQ